MNFSTIEQMSDLERKEYFSTLTIEELLHLAVHFTAKLSQAVDEFVDASYDLMDQHLEKHEQAARDLIDRL